MKDNNKLKEGAMDIKDLKKLTPKNVLDVLKQGNKDFISDNLTVRNNSKRVRDYALEQTPIAVVLSCLDSRLPVEDIFHRGIGEMFVTRIAGNIVNSDILGSLEYACKISTAKLLLVLGHEHCGAVKASIDNVKAGHMYDLLLKIKPAINKVSRDFKGKKNATSAQFVKMVSLANVKNSVDTIRSKSHILKNMENKGEILIVGGMYNMHKGRVKFLKNI